MFFSPELMKMRSELPSPAGTPSRWENLSSQMLVCLGFLLGSVILVCLLGFGLGLGLRLGFGLGLGFRSFGRCLLGHDDAVLGGDRDEVRAALIEDETGG